MTKESMLPWALYFAQQHYRVVLVDLRGHGRSSGSRIGFGAWEADDLMKVTDELERRGLLAGKLGVFGVSYGAAVGIQWAARDPRVATLVVLAPFSDAQTAIPDFARGFDPRAAGKLSIATFAAAGSKAAPLAGFQWSDVNVVEAIRRVQAPVLFFHGQNDTWVLPSHSEVLYLAAAKGSRRVVMPDDNHISLQLRVDLIAPEAQQWLDERLNDAPVLVGASP
jgi:pimeloyl-ACP methyl ester carboxylesterase